MNNVKFLKVNGEENEDIMVKCDISAFPTFVLFKKGKLLDSKACKLDENELKKFINSQV